MTYPENYRYTKEHEWIHAEGDTGTMGITFYAQQELGDIVYVELPAPGAVFQQKQQLGTVESVKAVSEIYSPVSGEIVAVNEDLVHTPEKLNEDPQGAAWLVKIRLTAPHELTNLLSAGDYQKYIATGD
ncbi:MAG TPA: glycine cleavage system protein GcvH [Bryobacteraceae bacterium]|nr:glycine cleavage system protein GcvH [Bryobacteraceae bacterium]